MKIIICSFAICIILEIALMKIYKTIKIHQEYMKEIKALERQHEEIKAISLEFLKARKKSFYDKKQEIPRL